MTWKRVCSSTDLFDGVPLGVVVDQVAVCIVRTGAEVFAVHDECTHEAVRLSEGDVDDGVIECWRHGSCFDLRTGAVLNLPAVHPVAVYPVREMGDEVQVDVPGP